MGGAPAKLVLPLDFPARPAEVHVHRDLCLALPHVEESGKVCLGTPTKPGDYESPAHAVADTLRDFETFLEKSADYAWVKDEFQRERLAYWARYCETHKRRRGFPTPKVVQVVLQPFEKQEEGNLAGFTHGSKDQRSQLWLATPGDIDANVAAHRHSWALTYKVEASRLPSNLYRPPGYTMGVLEVTAASPTSLGRDIFKHPRDIDDFAIAIEEAIRKLQDQWRIKKVHLIVGAPASACFRIGQKLQARHHATVVCYEALPGAGAPFRETIEIANDKVTELQTGQSIALL